MRHILDGISVQCSFGITNLHFVSLLLQSSYLSYLHVVFMHISEKDRSEGSHAWNGRYSWNKLDSYFLLPYAKRKGGYDRTDQYRKKIQEWLID